MSRTVWLSKPLRSAPSGTSSSGTVTSRRTRSGFRRRGPRPAFRRLPPPEGGRRGPSMPDRSPGLGSGRFGRPLSCRISSRRSRIRPVSSASCSSRSASWSTSSESCLSLSLSWSRSSPSRASLPARRSRRLESSSRNEADDRFTADVLALRLSQPVPGIAKPLPGPIPGNRNRQICIWCQPTQTDAKSGPNIAKAPDPPPRNTHQGHIIPGKMPLLRVISFNRLISGSSSPDFSA